MDFETVATIILALFNAILVGVVIMWTLIEWGVL